MKRSSNFEEERTPKRSGAHTMPCVLKFLTPEALASAIIGKGGAVIAEMRQKTQAKISLTEHSVLYPGTDARVLTASGNTPESMGDVANLIIVKVNDTVASGVQVESLGSPGDLKLNVLVPKVAVGGIIGKGGTNVKQLRETSGGKISIQEPIGPPGPGADQVVSLGGSKEALEYLMAEVNKQVQALSQEPWFPEWASTNPADAMGMGMMGMGGGGGKGGGKNGGYGRGGHGPGVDMMMQVAQGLPPYVMEDSRGFALSCVVPNRLVGGIIGRAGSGTKEVQSLTNTKIGIREIPGDPDNRSMNIAGPLANACAAYMMMMKRYLDSEAASQQGHE
eukprot:TRINITY_DN1156_c0_g2_i1.p1 TRINITY_DN1156_c0_g2~~TRINITY_DN1156_c0_g2_i1.p1  ORF type:complete len:335 (-),score=87.47 TRINITY_DN1156_c0_g2_i1:159-1163(-)